MATISYLETFFLLLCLSLLCYACWSQRRHRSSLPTSWPVVRMLPGLLQNVHRIYDYSFEILKKNGGTFMLVGPWFGNMDMLVTSDPANVRHILNNNFSNFPKGPDFNEIFDVLGDGIFNSDSVSWENQRKTAMSVLNHPRFLKFVANTTLDMVKNVVFPILDRASELGIAVELQDLFGRLTFDSSCRVVFGQDSTSASIGLSYNEFGKALVEAEEAVFYRHILPKKVWKLQRRLHVGQEKKVWKAREVIEHFVANCISLKREELRNNTAQMEEDGKEASDLLTTYMKSYDGKSGDASTSQKFLQDTLVNFIFAGKDTISVALTWLFWLLATNPSQENKLFQEIKKNFHPKDQKLSCFSNLDVLKKVVYLHGTACEALRLFPPVPFQHKTSVEAEVLPSGHKVGRNTRILIIFYAMGRMENIWGGDCLEFKPERWITEQGGMKHEPSFKFTAFNSGPRTCLGKDMALIQVKMVVAAIVYNYSFQVVNGSTVSPKPSVALHMKDGLKVRVTKRRV